MPHTTIDLPSSPAEALRVLREASRDHTVLVFKKSPICPTSSWAERELRSWLRTRPDDVSLSVAWIDVIAERALARGLTAALDIPHESPQALVFGGGELLWSGSHEALTEDNLRQHVDRRQA